MLAKTSEGRRIGPSYRTPSYRTGVSRAIRNVQRILSRSDLDPFNFIVEFRAAFLDDGETLYVLEISTVDRTVSVRKLGIPRTCIEEDKRSGDRGALSGIVEKLIPDLLDAMKFARGGSQMILVK